MNVKDKQNVKTTHTTALCTTRNMDVLTVSKHSHVSSVMGDNTCWHLFSVQMVEPTLLFYAPTKCGRDGAARGRPGRMNFVWMSQMKADKMLSVQIWAHNNERNVSARSSVHIMLR